MIVYPAASYNSFISLDDADTYFQTRLNAEKYTTQGDPIQTAALITAFRSINELDLTIDPTAADQIQALKDAQCEQALHELRKDLDSQNPPAYLPIDLKYMKNKELPRYAQRALAMLRPYLQAPTCQVVR